MRIGVKEESIGSHQVAERLEELVVGRRIMSWGENTLVLDNGIILDWRGTGDCCAWGDVAVQEVINSEHVITSVKSVDNDNGYYGDEVITLLTNAGPAAKINNSWDGGSGYYFFGIELTIKGVKNV